MIKVMRRNLILLKVIGAWKDEKLSVNIITSLILLINVTLQLIMVIGTIIESYKVFGNLIRFTFSISACCLSAVAFAKVMCLRKHHYIVKEILFELGENLASKYDINSNEMKYIEEGEKIISFRSKVYLLITFIGCLSWLFAPIFKEILVYLGILKPSDLIHYPFSVWTPSESSSDYVNVFIYVVQFTYGFLTWLSWIGIDIFFSSLVIHCCGHLKILIDRVKNGKNDENTDESLRSKNEKNYLVNVILYHLNVLELCKTFEGLFEKTLFIQFVCSTTVCICCGFQVMASTVEDASHVFANFLILCCMLLSWLAACFFGSMLTTTSEELSTAIYFSDWTNLSPSNKKIIFFVLERSQKSITISAGKFYTLSLRLFLDMLKMFYSFLAVLKEMSKTK